MLVKVALLKHFFRNDQRLPAPTQHTDFGGSRTLKESRTWHAAKIKEEFSEKNNQNCGIAQGTGNDKGKSAPIAACGSHQSSGQRSHFLKPKPNLMFARKLVKGELET